MSPPRFSNMSHSLCLSSRGGSHELKMININKNKDWASLYKYSRRVQIFQPRKRGGALFLPYFLPYVFHVHFLDWFKLVFHVLLGFARVPLLWSISKFEFSIIHSTGKNGQKIYPQGPRNLKRKVSQHSWWLCSSITLLQLMPKNTPLMKEEARCMSCGTP